MLSVYTIYMYMYIISIHHLHLRYQYTIYMYVISIHHLHVHKLQAYMRQSGSHSEEAEVGPHLLQQVVKVPLVMGGHWNCMRYLVDDVQFLSIIVELITHLVPQQTSLTGCLTSMEIWSILLSRYMAGM